MRAFVYEKIILHFSAVMGVSERRGRMHRKPKIDVLTLMALLETVRKETKRQRLTTTRMLKLTGVGSLHTIYGYVRFACEEGLMRVVPVWDGNPYGAAKYYYLTAAGQRLLRAWKRRRG